MYVHRGKDELSQFLLVVYTRQRIVCAFESLHCIMSRKRIDYMLHVFIIKICISIPDSMKLNALRASSSFPAA